jgi:hypothetical protein
MIAAIKKRVDAYARHVVMFRVAFDNGPNRRAQDRQRAAAEAAARAKRAEAERKAVTDAQKIVAIWNARQAGGRTLWFYPTIGAAIIQSSGRERHPRLVAEIVEDHVKNSSLIGTSTTGATEW